MAAVVATEDPEIAAKKVQATMDTREIPPEIHPTRESAKATRRLESPPFDMTSPASMNAGIASIEKLLELAKILCAMTTKLSFGSRRTATTQESPSAHVISRPHAMATRRTTINAIAAVSIIFPPLLYRILPRYLLPVPGSS